MELVGKPGKTRNPRFEAFDPSLHSTWQYPISGYNQAKPLNIRLILGTPVARLLLKQMWPGMVLNKSFSICLDVIRWSFEEALTICKKNKCFIKTIFNEHKTYKSDPYLFIAK